MRSTLGLRGPDEPFGTRVQIGTPRREDNGRDAAVAQQAPKGRRVQRIAIEDDVPHAAQEALVGGSEVSSELPERLARCKAD